ncbi:hypothetical protein [Paenibacillus piri]|uniref:Uncharacterized protein n=1 Tax=Paenibacillus piri TaxID=2547395 RepID=A0A4R5KCA1_9BACL|nr:hypothetical protein [Paenibacillus piri]TDF92128.1 hypothetical protein E1757_30475 [Paenibacillus piri]
MTRKKTYRTVTRPFNHVHSTLTALGFTQTATKDGCCYALTFRDPRTDQQYMFGIPTRTADNGWTEVLLHEAAFKDKGEIPSSAMEIAVSVMMETKQYLSSHEPKPASIPIEIAQNGRMASNNASELKRLGKEMANMPTNAQVIENGMVPDPIQ